MDDRILNFLIKALLFSEHPRIIVMDSLVYANMQESGKTRKGVLRYLSSEVITNIQFVVCVRNVSSIHWTLVIVDLTKDFIEITHYDGFQTGPIPDCELHILLEWLKNLRTEERERVVSTYD